MKDKYYNKYKGYNDKYSVSKEMIDRLFEGYTNPCPTAEEIDWHKRVVNLDQEPRPDYYGGKDNTYEVFQVLEAWGLDKDFYLGNVIKYLARAGKKNILTKKEDLQKALVYLQKRIDTL